jgi:riboflavin synthase
VFTGIIEELGTLIASHSAGSGLRLQFSAEKVLSDLKTDDSISINGVCQTVISVETSSFEVIAVPETLKKTNFSSLKIGESVNLERAAMLSSRLGGHLVQGHIDGVALTSGIKDIGGSWMFEFELPVQFMRYVIAQGSIAINGISLTVAELEGNGIRVAIIPHTYEVTNMKYLCSGDFVNIELDCMAKMIERLMEAHRL